MNPLPRLMLPAFLLVACGTGLVPLPRMPTVSISIPDSRLTIGSRFTFTAAVDISSSLYVFVVDPEGRVDQLLPNRTAAGSPVAPALRVNANQVIAFPPADARFTVETEPPLGQYTVLAFASAQALSQRLRAFSADPSWFPSHA